MNAHNGSIRHAVFLSNTHIVSVSDDCTMRMWDRTSGQVNSYLLSTSCCPRLCPRKIR